MHFTADVLARGSMQPQDSSRLSYRAKLLNGRHDVAGLPDI